MRNQAPMTAMPALASVLHIRRWPDKKPEQQRNAI
jgi:hypothetical protein